MKLKKFIFIALGATLVAIGILIGKFIEVPSIKVDPTINLLHGLSILTTLFVAIVIAIYFDTQKKKDSIQKEIMIKRIDKIVDSLDDLQKDVSIGKVVLQFAIAFPKRFKGSIDYVWDALSHYEIAVSVEKDEIIKAHRELRALLTTTPIPAVAAQSKDLASVADDSLIYSTPKIAQIITVIETLKNDLFKVQLDINAS